MVSILLPTYNGEKYISESIDSIKNQSFQDWELLIGFNGTTDGTKKIVEEYSDNRIRSFDYGFDKGKSKTLNKLLKESKYDFICLQDDDDVWDPFKLEKQLPSMEEHDVVGTFINYINENGDFVGTPSLSIIHHDICNLSLSGNNQIANTTTMFKKLDTLEIGGWKEGIDGMEDYDFWLRLIRMNKKFYNIPEKLVLHRIHSNSNFNTSKYDLKKIL